MTKPTPATTPNRLIREKSPYLLQHAYNPVDWYPWGEEAFAKAKSENKPIFLSIGYSTCYWCHVMEREVFENPEIARLMNEHLVCIKVDREERPDIDRIYMTAVQALTGSGGWPMSMFLTPALKPFFGGTYFPPVDKYGRPGFLSIVNRIAELWQTDQNKIFESSEEITSHLISAIKFSSVSQLPGDEVLEKGFQQFSKSYDALNGGFGTSPKFPRPVALNFLFRYYARTGNKEPLDIALFTLQQMAKGGVYDQIGGGFHRYSVDGEWRVPHFEKMLYDQAQLVISYLDAYQITQEKFYGDIAKDVLAYVLKELSHAEGGFYSAEDAESAYTADNPEEKEEGVFYLWTKADIDRLLPADEAAIVCYYYGVNEKGNALADPQKVFTNQNILYVAHTVEETSKISGKPLFEIDQILKKAMVILYSEREKRPRPHLDDKILTAWNGLMISALARAYQIFEDPKYLDASLQAAHFIASHLYNPKSGSLLRRYRDGEARFDGTLQDYAYFIAGLLDLYEASFDTRWIDLAVLLQKKQHELFWDNEQGGYFDSAAENATLILRTKEDYDSAEPTGNSFAALNLLRLAHLTDNTGWRTNAEETIRAFGTRLERTPEVMPQMLVALDWILGAPKEIVITGTADSDGFKKMLREIHSHYLPNMILMVLDDNRDRQYLSSYLPFLWEMNMIDGNATAYVCENYSCKLPATDLTVLRELLTDMKSRGGQP